MRGSVSGDLCGQQIQGFDLIVTLSGRTYDHMMMAERPNDGFVGRRGDSGAPLVRSFWDATRGRWYDRPVGQLSGIARQQTSGCPGDPNVALAAEGLVTIRSFRTPRIF